MALIDSGKKSTGVFSAGRALLTDRTLRTDKWWLQPALTFSVLILFVIYATFRAFENKYYFAEPLISPALFILIFPLGFRMTCYYYRKAYYRSFWMSPPACAVAEPHKKYTGETRAPLILQNGHRWFFYAGLVFNILLTYDAVIAFKNEEGQWGHMSVGTLVLLLNATLLWLYSASCHTCRHTIGGRLKNFSKHPVRYKAWTVVSKLNHYHPNFAWVSLFGVALTDLYVRQVASGAITNFYFF